MPTIARWPGRVPAGATCSEFAATIDVLPTIGKLIGAELPEHRIDGLDISPLLFGTRGAVSPHELFCCHYQGGELQAVRDARWKLHFPHKYAALAGRPGGRDGTPAPYEDRQLELSLFDLRDDPGETRDVAAQHADVVLRLQRLAEAAREDLGDKRTGQKGAGVREPGRLGPDDTRLR